MEELNAVITELEIAIHTEGNSSRVIDEALEELAFWTSVKESLEGIKEEY